MPYSSIRLAKPFLPIPVCLEPSIAINVPSGNDALVSGTNVTLVRSPKDLVKVIPCFALLPIDQPSFPKSLISCLPESTKVIKKLGRSGDGLNMRSIECLFSYWGINPDAFCWSCTVKFNGVFLKESRGLSHVPQSIQVKQDGFLKFFLGFWDRATKCSRTELFTISYPSSIFFSELKSNDNITVCYQGYLLLPLKQGFSELAICQLYIILPFVKGSNAILDRVRLGCG